MLFGVTSTVCSRSGGRISPTPPTFVDTQYRPKWAASTKAIPKDSVSAGLRNISHCLTIYIAFSFGRLPCKITIELRLYFYIISFKGFILGPSPTTSMINRPLFLSQNVGKSLIKRSVPLLYTSLPTTTILIFPLTLYIF